jgi:hypothetical protein
VPYYYKVIVPSTVKTQILSPVGPSVVKVFVPGATAKVAGASADATLITTFPDPPFDPPVAPPG